MNLKTIFSNLVIFTFVPILSQAEPTHPRIELNCETTEQKTTLDGSATQEPNTPEYKFILDTDKKIVLLDGKPLGTTKEFTDQHVVCQTTENEGMRAVSKFTIDRIANTFHVESNMTLGGNHKLKKIISGKCKSQ